MEDKFKGYYYSKYKVIDFDTLERNDIVNGDHLLLEIGRGGIDVYKIMKLSEVYKHYGYFWIRDRINLGFVIVQP